MHRLTGLLLAVLPGLMMPAVLAQPAPDYAGVDHVEFFVNDLDTSLAFYTRLFGSEVWKNRNTARRYLPLGESFMALEQGAAAHVDHVCMGIDDFSISAVHNYLSVQQLPWQDYPSGNDLRVDDKNGIRTQLAASHGWAALTKDVAQPDFRKQDKAAIFRPLQIDEIYLMVTNLEVDSLFYARMLGQTGVLQAGSLWFKIGNGRLRISQTPVGQSPGINYISVLVGNTDLGAAAEAVFAAGGIIENILPNGFSFWDPDGLRMLVRTGNLF